MRGLFQGIKLCSKKSAWNTPLTFWTHTIIDWTLLKITKFGRGLTLFKDLSQFFTLINCIKRENFIFSGSLSQDFFSMPWNKWLLDYMIVLKMEILLLFSGKEKEGLQNLLNWPQYVSIQGLKPWMHASQKMELFAKTIAFRYKFCSNSCPLVVLVLYTIFIEPRVFN